MAQAEGETSCCSATSSAEGGEAFLLSCGFRLRTLRLTPAERLAKELIAYYRAFAPSELRNVDVATVSEHYADAARMPELWARLEAKYGRSRRDLEDLRSRRRAAAAAANEQEAGGAGCTQRTQRAAEPEDETTLDREGESTTFTTELQRLGRGRKADLGDVVQHAQAGGGGGGPPAARGGDGARAGGGAARRRRGW